MAMLVYCKPETEKSPWIVIPATRDALYAAVKSGVMFSTWTRFSHEPGNGAGEPIRYGDFVLDFDCKENPTAALQDMRALCLQHLPEQFGIDPNAIKHYISGSKGYHAVLPEWLFGHPEGHVKLPLIYKWIAQHITRTFPLKTLDMSLYCMGKGKMFRLPNVKRSNGRYKVPISLQEVMELSAAQLDELSMSPRRIDKVDLEIKPNVELKALWEQAAQEVADLKSAKSEPLTPAQISQLSEQPPPCVRYILSKQPAKSKAFNFNRAIMLLVNFYQDIGVGRDSAMEACREFVGGFVGSDCYNTPALRVEHFLKMWAYMVGQKEYFFSCGRAHGLKLPREAYDCMRCIEVTPKAAFEVGEEGPPFDFFGDTTLTGKPEWPACACPEVIEAFAHDEAERIGVDTPMVAIPAIVCAAVAISDAFQIQPKEHDYTWRESPRLWAAIVADPGQKKTPALNAAFAPLREIERQSWLAHKEDMAEYARKIKPILEAAKKKSGAASEAEAVPEPEKPVHLRRLVDDITIEALRKILAVNPGGVGCVKDELSGWIKSFDMYREKQGGKDRADYCELYQGGSKLFDRVQEGFVYVPNWGASIVGGIQPGVIGRTLGKITEDGLLARFLVVFAGRDGRGEDRPPDRRALGSYQETIQALCRLEPKREREVCRFSPGAVECREIVVDIIEAMQALPDTSDALKGHLNKFESAFCRLALVFHITEAVARGERPADTVSGETAQMAGRLLLDFLFPNSMRFYRELVDIGGPHTAVQKVAGYILAGGVEVLTRRDLLQDFRKLDPVSFQACIRALEAANWMDPAKTKRDGTVTSWAIKPAVHLVFAERAKTEKVRREAEKVKIAEAVRLLRLQREGKNEPV